MKILNQTFRYRLFLVTGLLLSSLFIVACATITPENNAYPIAPELMSSTEQPVSSANSTSRSAANMQSEPATERTSVDDDMKAWLANANLLYSDANFENSGPNKQAIIIAGTAFLALAAAAGVYLARKRKYV